MRHARQFLADSDFQGMDTSCIRRVGNLPAPGAIGVDDAQMNRAMAPAGSVKDCAVLSSLLLVAVSKSV